MIKCAIEELRYYLAGRHFVPVTDHTPLQWMAKAKETNARVTRWFLSLQEFSFQVQHREGTHSGNADGLSRRDALWARQATAVGSELGGVLSRRTDSWRTRDKDRSSRDCRGGADETAPLQHHQCFVQPESTWRWGGAADTHGR